MQIQLKQNEIVAALKQYISSQGINLAGKEVTISFTAGRKEAGITADLSIEEAGIPGFDGGEEEATKPTLTVVPPVVKAAEEPALVLADPEVQETATAEPEPEPATKTPTSLFN